MSGSCYCDVCKKHESVCICHDTCLDRIRELEATIERVRGASREILKEQKGPCGRLSDPAWSAYESALEYIAAALDPTTEGS